VSAFVLHPGVYDDLEDIWEFIAKDNLKAADKVVDDIYITIDLLVPFPHRGHRRTDLTSRPLRFQAVRNT